MFIHIMIRYDRRIEKSVCFAETKRQSLSYYYCVTQRAQVFLLLRWLDIESRAAGISAYRKCVVRLLFWESCITNELWWTYHVSSKEVIFSRHIHTHCRRDRNWMHALCRMRPLTDPSSRSPSGIHALFVSDSLQFNFLHSVYPELCQILQFVHNCFQLLQYYLFFVIVSLIPETPHF